MPYNGHMSPHTAAHRSISISSPSRLWCRSRSASSPWIPRVNRRPRGWWRRLGPNMFWRCGGSVHRARRSCAGVDAWFLRANANATNVSHAELAIEPTHCHKKSGLNRGEWRPAIKNTTQLRSSHPGVASLTSSLFWTPSFVQPLLSDVRRQGLAMDGSQRGATIRSGSLACSVRGGEC